MKKPCKNCPFVAEQQGRPYLSPQRMDGIKFASALGAPFYCHKTIKPNDSQVYERHWQQCRGATLWAQEHGHELLRENGIILTHAEAPAR